MLREDVLNEHYGVRVQVFEHGGELVGRSAAGGGRHMRALMVQGTTSWAGKSLLVTALARLIARRGISVAPFKAQNMSNNARVVSGGEIGVAQYLQALAAGVEPDVRMNPVLVKPEGDSAARSSSSAADMTLSRMPWRERAGRSGRRSSSSLRSLAADYELVLIEGAGSPAEINLRTTDLANMRSPGSPGPVCCSSATSSAGRVRAPLRDLGVPRRGRPTARTAGSS